MQKKKKHITGVYLETKQWQWHLQTESKCKWKLNIKGRNTEVLQTEKDVFTH